MAEGQCMKCPTCGFEQSEDNHECIKCGIVYEKYYKWQERSLNSDELGVELKDSRSGFESLRDTLFHVDDAINPLVFYGRLVIFMALFIWGIKMIMMPLESNYAGETFWHLINLPFHEAGHIVFRMFGRVIHSLGGTLGQLLMPLICLMVLLLKTKDPFGAAFCLWWLGENFMDIAPYINDARTLTLPLLGGNTGQTSPYGFHDWEFILTELDLLHHDHLLAQFSQNVGIFLMLLSFVWGGVLLCKQKKHLMKFDT